VRQGDKCSQLEAAAAIGATVNVNLERSFHKLRVRAIDRAMRGRPLAMRMRRLGLGLRRRWHNERTQLGGRDHHIVPEKRRWYASAIAGIRYMGKSYGYFGGNPERWACSSFTSLLTGLEARSRNG
jgi:hypothetical protein